MVELWSKIILFIVDTDVPLPLSLSHIHRPGSLLWKHYWHCQTQIFWCACSHWKKIWTLVPLMLSKHNCFFYGNAVRSSSFCFNHSTSEKLYSLLSRARLEELKRNDLWCLKAMVLKCSLCVFSSSLLHWFKSAIRDEKKLSHTFYDAFIYLDLISVLHTFKSATRYQAARF